MVDDKLTVDKVLRSLAIFSGDLSPKELYAQERAEEIVEERGDNFPKGATRNMALSEFWNGMTSAEKNEWKDRAHTLSEDVER